MNSLSHFLRRHYGQWKRDTIMQGDFGPSLSILGTPKVSVLIGIFGALDSRGAFGAKSAARLCVRSDTFINETRG